MVTYKITSKKTKEKIIRHLPRSCGVYIYRNKKNEVLYVGKAKNLFNRVGWYFKKSTVLDRKTSLLVGQIACIQYIQTIGEFDALLLEAKLIHDYNPKYNIITKDDKSPLYVYISLDEPLPRILFIRKKQLSLAKSARYVYGPFQSGATVRMIVRQLRKIIPYCTQKKRDGTPCFYTHLHLCDPCPSAIANMPIGEKRDQLIGTYRKNITNLAHILSGDTQTLTNDLEKEMKQYAKANDFEHARVIRDQLRELQILMNRTYDPNLYIEHESFLSDIYADGLSRLVTMLRAHSVAIQHLHRIECIDISNIHGTYATGSLVVFIDGQPDTSLYRRFRIHNTNDKHDVAMIKEVLTRRLHHTEWELPNLFVIDGGKPQARSALAVLQDQHATIPIIALAKRNEEIIIPFENSFTTLRIQKTSSALHIVERIRDEAHRFALAYHKTLRRTGFV